jgi:hypothetical protein
MLPRRARTRRGMRREVESTGNGQRNREPVGLWEGSWPPPSVSVAGPDLVMA